jgi:phytoene dehydrogenase-like protein
MPKTIAIVGAGLGGLTAGNLLVDRGHKVTIFESFTRPGGYTAGFRRQGYYFESGTLSFESSGVFEKMMADLGLSGRLPLVRMKMRMVSPHFDFVADSLAALKDALYAAFPGDRAGLDGYFGEIEPLVAAMRPLVKEPIPPQFEGFGLLKALLPYAVAGPRYALRRRRVRGLTVDELAAKHFRPGTPAYRFFIGLGYPKMEVSTQAGMFLVIAEDYWHVRDGMQRWADLLADRFRGRGGDLRPGSPVERILTAGGAAAGVLSKGERFAADAVVSGCDYKKTFLILLDDPSIVPQAEMGKIRDAAVSEGIFTVYLGLRMSGAELASKMKTPSVGYMPLDRDVDPEDAKAADHFEKDGFSLYSPSLINPELAPEGRSSLMLQAVCPAHWQDDWRRSDPAAYRALKARVRGQLVDRAEAIVPGLRAAIEFEDAATPLTYERYTGNTDGATSGWSWNPKKPFYKGGAFATTVATPVRNLWIGSCWAGQIGGIPNAIAAAYLASKKIGR